MCMSAPFVPVHPLRAILPHDHLLHSLLVEHVLILTLVDRLERVCEALEQDEAGAAAEERLVDLLCLVHYLNRAESHDHREEVVLFPAMALRGVEQETSDVVLQHRKVSALKERLRSLASPSLNETWRPDLERVTETARELISAIRQHIEFEEDVLFPLALDAIVDDETWVDLARAAPAEHPCSFRLRPAL
jgi:hemerythrin-like domain-containing protein